MQKPCTVESLAASCAIPLGRPWNLNLYSDLLWCRQNDDAQQSQWSSCRASDYVLCYIHAQGAHRASRSSTFKEPQCSDYRPLVSVVVKPLLRSSKKSSRKYSVSQIERPLSRSGVLRRLMVSSALSWNTILSRLDKVYSSLRRRAQRLAIDDLLSCVSPAK